MSSELTIRPKASQQLAALIGMDPSAMLDTIKVQCFKTNPANVSNEQLAAFVSIAAEMGVNPLLPGMLYAYPTSGGGVVPIMGPDGVYKKLSEHPDVDSWETVVYPEDVSLPPTHAITRIWRKGRERPLSFTALLAEWRVSSNPNWNTRTRHMLGLRSLKQCARQIIHGIPGDEDDRHIMGEINVTPATGAQEQSEAPAQTKRADPPPRQKKGAAAVETKPVEKAIDTTATEVVTTPVTEKKPDAPAPAKPDEGQKANAAATALKSEDPAPETPPPAAEAKPTARAFLKDKEELTAACHIVEVSTLLVNEKDATTGAPISTPSISAQVKGGFTGSVLHIGGAKFNGKKKKLPGGEEEPEMDPNPLWKPGADVTLSLFGRLLKSGKILVIVKNIEAGATSSAAMEVE